MGAFFARFGLLLLLVAPLGASAVSPPRVVDATPGTDGRTITRFTIRFSDPMIALGRQEAPPFEMDCPVDGSGQWIDTTTYVWDYAKPLPGSTVCTATLSDTLRTLAGREITGTRSFPIDSGGPFAVDVLPSNGEEGIDEDQVFFIAANGPVTRASVAAAAYCAVDGIGDRIAVDLIAPNAVEPVLGAMSRWRRESFLRSAGLETGDLPAQGAQRETILSSIVGLKCRRPLPPGRDVAVVWAASVRSTTGRLAGADQRFDFTVRDEFRARLSCGRVNTRAGCNPIEAIKVLFTAPVPRAQALATRIDVGGGRMLAPVEDGNDNTLSEVRFKPVFPSTVTAKVVLPQDLRDESGRPLANARRFPLEFAIDEPPPLVKFAAPFGILEAKEGGVLPVTVRGVEPSLTQGVKAIGGAAARIEDNDKAIAEWVRKVAQAQESDYREEGRGRRKTTVNYTGATPILGGRAEGVQRMQLALPGKGRQFEVIGMPLTKPGFYVVELASPTLGRALLGRPATRYVNAAALVTDLSVHFKWGRSSSLAWVTSLSEGAPVAGASVRVTDSCTGLLLASGTTDRFGRIEIESGLPAPSTSDGCREGATESPPLMISARSGGDFSFTLTNWGDGIRPYDFDLPYGWGEPEAIFHTVFDRTLLRAGETVHMKHVYRMPTARGFRSSGAREATLVLQHRGSETSFEMPLSIGADGIGENEWEAPKDAPSGDYDLRVKIGEETNYTGGSFRLDEYRLPSMRATVSGPKTIAPRAKRLPLDLYLGYLSGGGAAAAAVKLRTAYETLYDSPSGWEGWSFGGSAVREGTVPLDEESNEPGQDLPDTSTLPLALDGEGALRTEIDLPELQDAARLTVEMDYEDANGETLTASTAIRLYTSAVRLGIKPDGWMQRAGDLRLKVVALGLDGRVLRGRDVQIALYTREILSARRRLIGGFYAYDNSARTKRLEAQCSGVTDAQGLAECSVDPGVSGEVIAVATTRDDEGNEARAVTSVYLAGDDEWWFGGDNGDRMDIIADAKEYRAGETAHVQVRMPFRDATALVTVEREGVLTSFVTTLSGKDPVVDVPIDGGYAPDAYISVMAIRGRVAGWRLQLSEFAKKLHLPFFGADPSMPTAIVDLAKPSYRIGMTRVKVGWDAHQLKVAVRPEHERYHVREQAQVAVQVLGPDGKPPQSAEIAFAAVDEALLILSPNESWDLLGAMMGERPISVLTSTAQMQVVGKRHYGRKALPTGGGGGGDLSALARADFRPLLLWRGRVPLDADGRATVSVPLAESLSSYKLVAIATSGEQLFGTGSATIRTVQELSIYSGVPPLVRTGDTFQAVFTLRNGTERPMTVRAAAEVQPGIAGIEPVTVTIPAGGAVPVSWPVTVPEGVEQLRWNVTAAAADGGTSDRVQIDQQVVPAVPEEVWAASFFRAADGLHFPVAAPEGALPGRGAIELAFTASPAPSLLGVRNYMAAYPYGCFEQRLSKAIALDDRAAWAKQMADLPAYMTPEGLLRYWPGENMSGSIALTAYALSITAEAGFPWPEERKARMIEAMRAVVDGRVTEASEGPADARLLRLSALAALARNGAATQAMLGQAAVPLRDMPTATLADWLVTIDRIRGVNPKARAAAEQALRSRIVYAGTRLDLVDRNLAPWWMMVSDDEMALKALIAVIGRPGWDNDAPRMMIGAALRQSRGHWDTTPANAWGTLAVRRFASAFPGQPTGVTTVQLGAQTLAGTWPNPAPLRFPLPAVSTPLVFAHPGGTPGWALTSVRAAVPLRSANFAGYRIAREVSFLQRQRPDRITRGDVIKVRLTLEASVDRTWVVVEDPLPAGASIISGGGQSALLAGQANGGNSWPSYIERGSGAWRGYFGWLPQGRTTVEYAVRINSVGRFQLPPTRVQAMYSPEINGAIPNAPFVVAP
ncbi:MAG TPA: MG2 domain-containing protein [Allosphingosinicella sp.]|jgi:hypothetical protein